MNLKNIKLLVAARLVAAFFEQLPRHNTSVSFFHQGETHSAARFSCLCSISPEELHHRVTKFWLLLAFVGAFFSTLCHVALVESPSLPSGFPADRRLRAIYSGAFYASFLLNTACSKCLDTSAVAKDRCSVQCYGPAVVCSEYSEASVQGCVEEGCTQFPSTC